MMWFAMGPSARVVTLAKLISDKRWDDYEKPKLDGDGMIIDVRDDQMDIDAEISVNLAQEPHVRDEAREIAEEHGKDRADRNEIAKFRRSLRAELARRPLRLDLHDARGAARLPARQVRSRDLHHLGRRVLLVRVTARPASRRSDRAGHRRRGPRQLSLLRSGCPGRWLIA